jgi:phenylpropionate dioxygenase-like ring-hydroxylating dioxygenase large terminal subunit
MRSERSAGIFRPTFARPDYKTRYLERRINCHYSFMHENLMDMNHQFLHRSLMGSIRAKALDVRGGDDQVEVDYTFTRMAGKQSFGEKFMLGENKAFAKYYFFVIWYPVGYWILSSLAAIKGVYNYTFQSKEVTVRWKSPDRGLHTLKSSSKTK